LGRSETVIAREVESNAYALLVMGPLAIQGFATSSLVQLPPK
jgi:hypothetical protein